MDGPWESTSLHRSAHLAGRQCDRRCGPTRTASRTLTPSSSRTATVSRTATESGTARAEWAPPWDEGATPGVQPPSQPIRLSGAPLFKAKASCAMAGAPTAGFPGQPWGQPPPPPRPPIPSRGRARRRQLAPPRPAAAPSAGFEDEPPPHTKHQNPFPFGMYRTTVFFYVSYT